MKDNIPNDKEKLEILVRLKYKANEKFEKIMNINPTTGKGNVVYNLIGPDINPLRDSLNRDLELSPEQQESFLEFYRGKPGFEPVPERIYKYFLANNRLNEDSEGSYASTRAAEKAKAQAAAGGVEARAGQSFLLQLVDIISIWFLLPIVFVCFVLDEGAILQFFIRLIPNRYFELALSIQEEVDEAIGKYLRGISMECGLVAISMAIGLFMVGVQFKVALLIGILSGLATAIPFLGPVVGLAFGLVYALIAEENHALLPFVTLENFAIAVVVVNIAVMMLDNLVFQPIVLGGAVNLHPLVVIIGIMGASILFGVAGVLLAIPTIVVVKVVTQHTFRGLKDYRII